METICFLAAERPGSTAERDETVSDLLGGQTVRTDRAAERL